MIEFDYTIKRNEGIEIRTFKPEKIKSPLPNISVISAPNSAGKSTLINIIALSLFGSDQNAKSVNSSLREQILSLTNFDIQKLTFSIRITDETGMNGFAVRKDNFDTKDITRKEIVDGVEKYIDSDRFHKNYELIYDIPDNPLERLKSLLNSVNIQQLKWKSELTTLHDYVHNSLKELIKINNENNAEEILKKISTEEEDKTYFSNNKVKLEQEVSKLEQYYFLRKYKETKTKYDSISEASKDLNFEKKKGKVQKDINLNQFREKAEQNRKLAVKIVELKVLIIQNIEETETSLLSDFVGMKSKLKQTPTIESARQDQLIIKQIEKRCRNIQTQYSEDSSIGEVEFFDKLSSWIRENMSANYQIPGTEITFSTLLEKMNIFVNSNRESYKKKKQLVNIIDWINDLDKAIDEFVINSNDIALKHKELSKAQQEIKFGVTSENSKDLNEEKKILKDELRKILDKLSKFGIVKEDDVQLRYNTLMIRYPELNDFDKQSLQLIFNNINTIQADIKTSTVNDIKINERLKLLNNQLNRAREIKPHKYQNKMNELNSLKKKISELLDTLNKWEPLIDNYKSFPGKDTLNSDSRNLLYFKKVSEYLAHRMKFVTHINQKHELQEVDLINSKFVAKDGKIIQFQVMGTGQRQLAYILNKLNYDGKIILAMFDEVAMMSPSTMLPIIERMKELKNESRLILGLLVSPNEEVKITGW